MQDSFASGVFLGLVICGIALLAILPFLTVYAFAQYNIFFTVVLEGQVRGIMVNDKFSRAIMSYEGYIFAHQDRVSYPNEDPWDIVEDVRKVSLKQLRNLLPSFMRNIYWIGIWPFAQGYIYRFQWTRLEQTIGKDGEVQNVPKFDDKLIDYVLVKDDIYITPVDRAETNEQIPLDIQLLLTLYVKNPYKALFRVQHWLESARNQIGARVRAFVGTKSYRELTNPEKSEVEAKAGEVLLSDEHLGGILKEIEKNWGVGCRRVQINKIDPGSDLAKNFIEASTILYVTEQKAKANEAEGRGLAARATALYQAVEKVPGGKEMFIAEAIRDSKISTLVAGPGGVMPAITVNPQK